MIFPFKSFLNTEGTPSACCERSPVRSPGWTPRATAPCVDLVLVRQNTWGRDGRPSPSCLGCPWWEREVTTALPAPKAERVTRGVSDRRPSRTCSRPAQARPRGSTRGCSRSRRRPRAPCPACSALEAARVTRHRAPQRRDSVIGAPPPELRHAQVMSEPVGGASDRAFKGLLGLNRALRLQVDRSEHGERVRIGDGQRRGARQSSSAPRSCAFERRARRHVEPGWFGCASSRPARTRALDRIGAGRARCPPRRPTSADSAGPPRSLARRRRPSRRGRPARGGSSDAREVARAPGRSASASA